MALIYKYIVLWGLFLLNSQIYSQKIDIGFDYFAGSGQSTDLGLDIAYTRSLDKNFFQMGIEIRSIDWGNHLGFILGYGREYITISSFKVGGITSLHPGLALFHQSSLGSYGLSHSFFFGWQSKKRSILQLIIGARYNISPGYKDFGIHQQFEFPITFKWGLRLGKMDN